MYCLIFAFLIVVFINLSCFAGKDDKVESQTSLKRIHEVCSFIPEDAELESTHNIVVLDKGFDTLHQDLCSTFFDSYDPNGRSTEVNQIWNGELTANIHGTATSGIIHDVSPKAKIIPIVYNKQPAEKAINSLDYALNKARGDIVNISLSLSTEGYVAPIMNGKIKELLISAFSKEKIIIIAAGNHHSPMDVLPRTIELAELAKLSNDKFIIVGATAPNLMAEEELWFDGSNLPTGIVDRTYLNTISLGSTYPGKKQDYQRIFIAAPSQHYTSSAYCGPDLVASKQKRYFGMTSSAAPVVTALAERLWTASPNSSASDIGHAIYNGTNQGFSAYSPEFYGEGMVNYKNSKALLQTRTYQTL
ncbi:MAG: S8/S53 family peptidase [Proteobacteria bacterium]|nr:S8/S53 family peptidase [Pseudomonadota bacterium]